MKNAPDVEGISQILVERSRDNPIKAYRIKLGLGPKRFAALVGLSIQAVVMHENGSKPAGPALVRYAAIGLDPTEILNSCVELDALEVDHEQTHG